MCFFPVLFPAAVSQIHAVLSSHQTSHCVSLRKLAKTLLLILEITDLQSDLIQVYIGNSTGLAMGEVAIRFTVV